MPSISPQVTPYYGGGQVVHPVDSFTTSGAPSTANINHNLGTLAIDNATGTIYGLASKSGGSATWAILGGGSGAVATLTGNSGGAISPSGGNITLSGGTLANFVGSGSTLTLTPKANGYPITPYVVGASSAAGYTTIQSAINAANAAGGGMIYIQPGTYTENLTFYDNIHLVSVIYENAFKVVINGTHTPPTSGSITIRGCKLVGTNAIFSSAAAGSTNISFEECTFQVTDGWMCDLLNWTGTINVNDAGSTGTNDGVLRNSAGAGLFTNNCQVGAGTTRALTMNGPCRLDLTFLDCPATISGGAIFVNFALFSQTITCSGTSSGTFLLINSFASGAAFNITSSSQIIIENSTITTANNPAIDGTGSVELINVGFGNSTTLAATLTVSTASTLVNGAFNTVAPTANLTISGTTVAAGGSNSNVDITLTPKGTGNVSLSTGNLVINGAAKQLRVHGGAVTDFIGQATLTNGTVTVANTNIAATDRVFVTRSAKNGSTAYGTFQVTITAATNFVITSCKSDTTTETGDASTVDYFIVRQA